MKERTVTVPELALIAGTRIAGGAGLGLLLADRLGRDRSRAVGFALLAVGVLTTFPLLAEVMFRSGRSEEAAPLAGSRSGNAGPAGRMAT
jgi:hypothetical protein